MPPIEVQELGGAYFVADGHHRIALARERKADFIDAEVTRLQTQLT
jgi:ParB-like chromosome segregation protein Spo0J